MIPSGEFSDQGGPLKPRRPWWFTLIVILAVIVPCVIPWAMTFDIEDGTLRMLIKLFPAYLILSGVCAWLAYPQRQTLSWILIALMLLSSASLFLL